MNSDVKFVQSDFVGLLTPYLQAPVVLQDLLQLCVGPITLQIGEKTKNNVSIHYSNNSSDEKPEPPSRRRLAANVVFGLGFAQRFCLFTGSGRSAETADICISLRPCITWDGEL